MWLPKRSPLSNMQRSRSKKEDGMTADQIGANCSKLTVLNSRKGRACCHCPTLARLPKTAFSVRTVRLMRSRQNSTTAWRDPVAFHTAGSQSNNGAVRKSRSGGGRERGQSSLRNLKKFQGILRNPTGRPEAPTPRMGFHKDSCSLGALLGLLFKGKSQGVRSTILAVSQFLRLPLSP